MDRQNSSAIHELSRQLTYLLEENDRLKAALEIKADKKKYEVHPRLKKWIYRLRKEKRANLERKYGDRLYKIREKYPGWTPKVDL